MAQESNGTAVMVQGRIVWGSGDLFKGQLQTEFGTKIPKLNKTTGEQMIQYGFGLAVPVTAFAALGPGQPGEIWNVIHNEAYTLYPSRQMPPAFAWKYKKGDTDLDDKGVPFSQREGYAGHVVFACTTNIPIKWFKFENGMNVLVNEGIKCGDYVNVQLSVRAHGPIGQGKPGLYLNPNAVQFLGFGKEIVNTPSGDQIFGTGMPQVPQGASATPLVPQGGLLVPAQPQYQQPPQPVGPVVPQYQQPPALPPQPHFGVVPQGLQPPPGGQPVGPAQPQWGQPAQPQYQQPVGMPTFPQVPQ